MVASAQTFPTRLPFYRAHSVVYIIREELINMATIPSQPTLHAVASFGEFVLANQEEITRRWVTVVDRSPEVPASEPLTYKQVLDHLPALCNELGMVLKEPNASGVRKQAARDAGIHGQKRWQQGYKLDELIREICLIRTELLGNW